VLRSVDPAAPALSGVVTESLAYSTLQAGPEFARWLADRGPAVMPDIADPVQATRDGDTLRIAFNRPQRHNADLVVSFTPGGSRDHDCRPAGSVSETGTDSVSRTPPGSRVRSSIVMGRWWCAAIESMNGAADTPG